MCQKVPHRVALAMRDLLSIIASIRDYHQACNQWKARLVESQGCWQGEPGLLAGKRARAAGRKESQGCQSRLFSGEFHLLPVEMSVLKCF